MVAAASLMAKVPATEVQLQKTTTEPTKEKTARNATPLAVPDLEDMLTTARSLARNSETLLSLIESLAGTVP